MNLNIQSYSIPVPVKEIIVENFRKLQIKASKLGCDIFIHWTGNITTQEFEFEGTKIALETEELHVSGNPPKFKGWKFVAVIEPLDDIDAVLIRATPGESVPEIYRNRNSATTCDHCKTHRLRKETYLLQNIETLEFKRVGSSCIQDFLGHDSPAIIASRWFSLLLKLFGFLDEYAYNDRDPHASGCFESYSITDFLANVHLSTRRIGWVSKKQADDDLCLSTSSDAWNLVSGNYRKYNPKHHEIPSAEDFTWAEESLKWINSINTEKLNDYMYNLYTSCSRKVVDHRTRGLAASLYKAYANHLEDMKSWQFTKDSNYIGTTGKREVYTLTLTKKIPKESHFGMTYIHKFLDTTGNVLMWFASKDLGLNQGNTYQLKGTVKKHEIFNNVKQTILSRCALI